MHTCAILTPSQETALAGLRTGIGCGDVVMLQCEPGMGRSTVLERFHEGAGGLLLGARQYMDRLSNGLPAAIEEAFRELMDSTLSQHELVILDDLHLIVDTVQACDYPRQNLFDVALTAVLDEARDRGKKLVFGMDRQRLCSLRRRAYGFAIPDFTSADYETICRAYLDGDVANGLDFARIHRFAPKLNAHQLRNCCIWIRSDRAMDTDRMIEFLRSQNLASNVDIQEVEAVRWTDLKGVDDVIEALEAKIALPFENDALATELQLKPKRGVLLAGPPGTGKTTIGRALAHRLKSKFFLIDGTVVAGSHGFYPQLDEVFEAAQRNAPSVVFIDDADVIFDGESKQSFCRYLLTKLDGLESASAGRVCVMMTTMDVGSLPAAVVRSGRVELWLETRLPDEAARAVILRDKLAGLPPLIGEANVPLLAESSQGLTGADLKAVVEDGKLMFAHDKVNGRPPRPADDYFLEAIETVRANRRRYKVRKPVELAQVKFGFLEE